MKIGKPIVEILKFKVQKENARKCAKLVIDDKYHPHRDISYIDDNEEHHKFDLYFSPLKNKKNCLVIDIHGGSYLFGHRKENYNLGTVFLDAGFDFVATDYVANNGKMSTFDLIDQNIKCICYIIAHQKELGLLNDTSIALTGDSAGGHMALTIAELFSDKEYQKALGYDLPDINIVAVLINCPVFNYVEVGLNSLTRRGNLRMFGPKAFDIEERKKICPRTHISSLKVPLFVSTCKHDFLRTSESLLLNEVVKNTDIDFMFMDLDEDDKKVGHVHNILDINHPASKKINNAMIDFINARL